MRYFDLSCALIKKLPESICSLYNLQTLILVDCHHLNELPSRIENLINMRYLDIRGARLKETPCHIGHLKSLQYLSNFIVGQKSGLRIGELKEISSLKGIFTISNLQNVKCGRDAMETNLKDKGYLDELVLKWDEGAGDHHVLQQNEDVIDNLEPHTNLKRLYIYCFGGSRFPTWVANPLFSNLRSLELENCKNCSSLPPLGQLPSLEDLIISGMNGIERVGSEFYNYHYGNASSSNTIKPCFPSLQTLIFHSMPNWEKWLCCGCRHGEFPCLRKLCIRSCPKLIGKLPKQLRSLKSLHIVGCPQLLVASLRAPTINELEMVDCGKLLLKRPAIGFTALQNSRIQISSISQWRQLPEGALYLSIKEHDSVETLIEEELLRSNTTCLLKSLEIKYCGFSRSLHRVGIPNSALKWLYISHCPKLDLLLSVLLRCHHPFLEYIYICDSTCDSLPLSFSLSIFPRLRDFAISNLEGLEFLSVSISEEDSTSHGYQVSIARCLDLVYIGLPVVELGRYYISRCRKLKLLAVAQKLSLSSLESLRLEDCPKLLLQRDGLPSNLHQLHILSCKQLTSQEDWGLQTLNSLTKFKISGGC